MAVTNNGIYIKNAGVNSGNAIWLKGANFTIDLRKQNQKIPIVGKTVTDGSKFDIVEIETGALENPSWNIVGNIDVDDTDANEVSERLLKDLMRDVTNPTFLTITVGITDIQLSNYKGTNDTGLGNDDNIPIEIEGITIKDVKSERSHFLRYTIKAFETTT